MVLCSQQREAFSIAKNSLYDVLVQFDPSKPLVVACYASQLGPISSIATCYIRRTMEKSLKCYHSSHALSVVRTRKMAAHSEHIEAYHKVGAYFILVALDLLDGGRGEAETITAIGHL